MLNRLVLQFDPVTDKRAIDALVYALSIELFIDHGIETTMPAYNILEFESDQHCTFAQLKLSANSRYTVNRY